MCANFSAQPCLRELFNTCRAFRYCLLLAPLSLCVPCSSAQREPFALPWLRPACRRAPLRGNARSMVKLAPPGLPYPVPRPRAPSSRSPCARVAGIPVLRRVNAAPASQSEVPRTSLLPAVPARFPRSSLLAPAPPRCPRSSPQTPSHTSPSCPSAPLPCLGDHSLLRPLLICSFAAKNNPATKHTQQPSTPSNQQALQPSSPQPSSPHSPPPASLSKLLRP